MTKIYKIKDFLKRIKNSIEIEDGVLYKRVTVSGNHKGVSLRDIEDGFKIGTKKQFTISGGDFILSKIDARNGAFGIIPNDLDGAIITGNFWTYKVDNELVNSDWFFYFTQSFNFIQLCIESSTGSTHRKYLNEQVFLNQNIFLPKIAEQVAMVEKYKQQSKISANLKREIILQKQLVSKLKQSILQDAIQGELTKAWRKENPTIETASKLLKRIKAEKAQLIKEKKIKKEKPLPAIRQEEIPFELPEGWVWCRLGDVLLYSDAGRSPQCETRAASSGEIGVLTTTSIQENLFDELANKVLPSTFEINEAHLIEIGDVLITRAGPLNRTGVVCKVAQLSRKLILSDKTIRLKYPENLINPDYLSATLNSLPIRALLLPKMTGMAQSQVNISQKNIKLTQFPLPPIEEQKAIVQKVETLLQKCTALEQEIAESEANAEMLMQAVLKEAFEKKEEKEVEVV